MLNFMLPKRLLSFRHAFTAIIKVVVAMQADDAYSLSGLTFLTWGDGIQRETSFGDL